MNRCKTTINFDELQKSIGLHREMESDLDAYAEVYLQAYREALEEGLSEGEAEEAARVAEEEAMEEDWILYYNAVIKVAKDLYDKHGLVITVPKKTIGRGRDKKTVPVLDKIKISPKKSWDDSAREIMETINGVGLFTFYSLEEFLDSGPYTPCEAVMSHLHWIASYPEVYGTVTAERRVEEEVFRRRNPQRASNPSQALAEKPGPVKMRRLKTNLLR